MIKHLKCKSFFLLVPWASKLKHRVQLYAVYVHLFLGMVKYPFNDTEINLSVLPIT